MPRVMEILTKHIVNLVLVSCELFSGEMWKKEVVVFTLDRAPVTEIQK